MIRILSLFFCDLLTSFKRRIYWLYRLSNSTLGNGIQIIFPVIREGKGELILGNNSFIGKNAELGIGEGGQLATLNNAYIGTKSVILIKNNFRLKIGNYFDLGDNSKLYVQNNWQFGNHVKIATHCAIFAREPDSSGVLFIGNNSHIGDYTIMDLVNNITIGNNVAIGPNCTIYTHDHDYSNQDLPAWKGGLVSEPIIIGDGAWVGSGVTILPGVTIGERAVIAAGSVVTKNISPNSIYGGIPAKFIKEI